MIPKIIHYCWYGGDNNKDKISCACIKTFKKAFDAERIIEWNESNCDLHANKYVEDAANLRKWAFVSDFFRLKALYELGGVYFDTDIKVRKPFEASWFDKDLVLAYEYEKVASAGVIMAKPGHPFIKKMLDEYETMPLDVNIPNNHLMTRLLQEYYPNFIVTGETTDLGENEVIFERHFFELPTLDKSKGYTIHYFNSSWHVHKIAWKQKLRPVLKWLQFHCFLFNWWYKNYFQKH